MASVILGVVIVLCFCFDYTNDVFWPPWAFLMLSLSGWITYRLIAGRKIPIVVALLFGYALINAVMWSHWRPLTAPMTFDAKAAIRAASSECAFQWTIMCGLFYTGWNNLRKHLALGLFWGGFLHTCFLIFDQVAPQLFPSLPQELFATRGLLGNRSIGASFTVVWFFMAQHLAGSTLKENARWLSLLAIPAIAVSVSSISFGAFFVGLGAWAIAYSWSKPHLRSSIPLALLGVAGLALVGWILGPYIDPEWGHHVSRQDAWEIFWKFYKDNGYLIFGSGAGTFKYFGPFIQEHEKYMLGRWWLWAHNDWLQIAFEFGFVGFVLAVASYIAIALTAFRSPYLFGAVISYGVIMVGNYPLHIAMFALLGFFVSFEAMWGRYGRKQQRMGGVAPREIHLGSHDLGVITVSGPNP